MAIDEAMLTAAGQGQALPTVRFYRWSQPTISLGHFQRFAEVQQLDEHIPGLLGSILGVDLETERQALDRLQQAGVVERRGKHWVATGALTVDTRANREALSSLRRHWTEVALNRMTAPPGKVTGLPTTWSHCPAAISNAFGRACRKHFARSAPSWRRPSPASVRCSSTSIWSAGTEGE